MTQSPYLLYSDGKGNIFEDKTLYAAGREGWDAFPIAAEEWILLPDGGNLYELPGRKGIGIDVKPAKCVCVKRLGRSGIYSACAYWPLPGSL